MISKERLLAGLGEMAFVEEGMVTLFANFSKVMVSQTSGIEESEAREMDKLLSVLYRDTARHKETIDLIVEEIRGDKKNEY